MDTLKIRQEEYEDAYRYIITKKLPIIVKVKLRGYKNLNQEDMYPFSKGYIETLANSMLYAITDIQDAVLGYCYHDCIIFVLRNDKDLDQDPWYQNDIQKISSIVSSLVTVGFIKSVEVFGKNTKISIDPIFSTKTFALPFLAEAINNLIHHQRSCMKQTISYYALHELSEVLGHTKANRILQHTTFEEKKEILHKYCDIDFFENYSKQSIYGVMTYKIPVITTNRTKNKWTLNFKTPDFALERDFIYNILSNGVDVFRANDFN